MIEINWPQLFTVILFITVAVVGIGHIKRRGEGRRSSIARNARALISVDGIADWDETCENAFFGLGKFWFFRATMILCLNAEL